MVGVIPVGTQFGAYSQAAHRLSASPTGRRRFTTQVVPPGVLRRRHRPHSNLFDHSLTQP